jgi:hypothetical protein
MRSLVAIGIIVLLAGCATRRAEKCQAEWLSAFGRSAPPGTIALNDSLYYDRTEVANLSWLEYEYWVRHIFGDGSLERHLTFLDTAGWYRNAPPDSSYAAFYLRHPAYRDYPVVGLTSEQAILYIKWRSDRVMEVYLVRVGIIPFRKDQMPDDHFSIERFYATDSLKAYHHLPYPSYDLPPPSEWRLAVAFSDSLAKAVRNRCRQGRGKDRKEGVKDGRFVVRCWENSANEPDHLAHIYWPSCGHSMRHIRGNVSELSDDSTIVLGGGWTDKRDSILLDQPFPYKAPNAATGFRNVCRWRKWDGARH